MVYMDLKIRELQKNESLPLDLLLLADPNEEIVKEYTNRGKCYVAEIKNNIVGVYVLIKTRPLTMELVNVAVDENYQGKGIGKKLVLDAIDKAKIANMKVIEVGTGNSGLSQLALYQKCGFKITWIDKDFFLKHYNEPIFENGIQCIDMIRMGQYI